MLVPCCTCTRHPELAAVPYRPPMAPHLRSSARRVRSSWNTSVVSPAMPCKRGNRTKLVHNCTLTLGRSSSWGSVRRASQARQGAKGARQAGCTRPCVQGSQLTPTLPLRSRPDASRHTAAAGLTKRNLQPAAHCPYLSSGRKEAVVAVLHDIAHASAVEHHRDDSRAHTCSEAASRVGLDS